MKRVFFQTAFIVVMFLGASLTQSLSAQDDYHFPVIYVDNPTNNSSLGNELFHQFAALVKEGVGMSRRTVMIDENTEKSLKLESDRRDSGTALDENSLFNRLTTAGADYIIRTQLNGGTYERIVPEKSTSGVGKFLDALAGTDPYYKANVMWNITITDIKNGRTIYNSSQTVEGRTSKQEENQTVAYVNAIQKIPSSILSIIKSLVPLDGKILKIEDVKKDKANSVILDLGGATGLSVRDNGTVYLEVDMAGETALREIGTIQISEVISANRSIAKVKKGNKEILSAFNKGQNLLVRIY